MSYGQGAPPFKTNGSPSRNIEPLTTELGVLLNNITDENGNIIGIDPVTRTLQTIEYEHHEIHSGRHYYLDRFVANVPINNVFDLQVMVPDVDRRLHVTFKINPQSETQWFFYEGVNIILAGTPVIPINNDRESLNTSVASWYEILNGSVALANADTAVAGATLLSSGIIGSGKDAGNEERTAELMLARNTNYSMRFIANAAGYIDYTYRWYEHISKAV